MSDALSDADKPPQDLLYRMGFVEWHDVPYGSLAREAMEEIERLRKVNADIKERYSSLLDQLGAGADM